MPSRDRAAVLVMPRPSSAWPDSGALWITAAGWAAAARARFGHAWVVTPNAVATPERTLEYASPAPHPLRRSRILRRVPTVVKTAVKDVRLFLSARRFSDVGDSGPWNSLQLAMVWQQHDLFASAGLALARRRNAPFVLFVHAPQVWEAGKWGTARPGWGNLLERMGERPILVAADVVACVSEEVADELPRFGVSREKIVVTPMSVDTARFTPFVSGVEVRRRHNLDGAFVVGWTGSFRLFHGLHVAMSAFALAHRHVPNAKLLLVGDGPQRQVLERRAAALGVADSVVFAGSVSHANVASYVAAMDTAFVTACADDTFHYSPLKLREYMACGKAVIAPRVGEMGRSLRDGVDALLYDQADEGGLAERIIALARAPKTRSRIGAFATQTVANAGTWNHQLARVCEALERLGWRVDEHGDAGLTLQTRRSGTSRIHRS
ncbi:MAG: glycosyltransferase [Gemmatimonadota bacterium]